MNSRKSFLALCAALLILTVTFAACSPASTDTQANRTNGSLANSGGNTSQTNGAAH